MFFCKALLTGINWSVAMNILYDRAYIDYLYILRNSKKVSWQKNLDAIITSCCFPFHSSKEKATLVY